MKTPGCFLSDSVVPSAVSPAAISVGTSKSMAEGAEMNVCASLTICDCGGHRNAWLFIGTLCPPHFQWVYCRCVILQKEPTEESEPTADVILQSVLLSFVGIPRIAQSADSAR